MKNKPISPEMLQPQAAYNPYDTGVAKAIEMTRRNSRMNHEQELEAFRNAIMGFSNGLAKQGPQGRQRGLLNNLAALNAGTVPAMEAYSSSKKNAEAENQAINQQLMLQEEKRQKRADEQSYKDWHKTHVENQLAETTRQHRETTGLQNRHYNFLEKVQGIKALQPTKEQMEENKKEKESEEFNKFLKVTEHTIDKLKDKKNENE